MVPNYYKQLLVLVFSVLLHLTSCVQVNEENSKVAATSSISEHVQTVTNLHPHQLNCGVNRGICKKVCNETEDLPWSSTFCDPESGSCICDCRDSISKDCEQTPFTPCFQNCVRKNPNPDVYLYEGGNCPVSQKNGTVYDQCACECTLRDDYEETNDVV